VFSAEDKLRARSIEAVMCDFRIDRAEILAGYRVANEALSALFAEANRNFPELLTISEEGLYVPSEVRPLTRTIAHSSDAYDLGKAGHSSAI